MWATQWSTATLIAAAWGGVIVGMAIMALLSMAKGTEINHDDYEDTDLDDDEPDNSTGRRADVRGEVPGVPRAVGREDAAHALAHDQRGAARRTYD